MQTLQWFQDRLGFTILRGRTEIEITSMEMATKLFEIQSDKYMFTDKKRIHRAPQAECESCSA